MRSCLLVVAAHDNVSGTLKSPRGGWVRSGLLRSKPQGHGRLLRDARRLRPTPRATLLRRQSMGVLKDMTHILRAAPRHETSTDGENANVSLMWSK